MSGKRNKKAVDTGLELEGVESYCILLRDLHQPVAKILVEVKDIDILRDAADDGIVFEEFVNRARAYIVSHALTLPEHHDIFVGFWGQWFCQIPASFFAFVVETGLMVTLDIDD